jgi:hypothetical protein
MHKNIIGLIDYFFEKGEFQSKWIIIMELAEHGCL